MSDVTANTVHISIEEEMRRSYLDYAMSVIVSRALPDVRDGLKPVHRRVLYAMRELGNDWNRPYKKSARVVGDVIGKYHPHGDSAVYNTMVRLAQDFSMRLPLVDGQGNFGSMDGDAPAAMRYTEVRMAKAAHALLEDLDKDTVDFRPNYDESTSEPTVLPARYPNLLINGTAGIAVGMATNVPPHNVGEIIDATIHLVDNPDASTETLASFVQGPDFPTGGMVMGRSGIRSAFENGRGSVTIRGITSVEETKEGRRAIIITEVPYQVNKAKLVERIAELVNEKIITGISDLRDESDRDGVRVVIELKRDAEPDVLLNLLYKHTPLQSSFGYNMLALDGGRPRMMGLKDVLAAFLRHREEIITRRTKFDLGKARDRAHVLVGLGIAVANIDEVIALIRKAPDAQTAKAELTSRLWPAEAVRPLIELLGEPMEGKTYRMTDAQAQAILDLRLQRLTGLERERINAEAGEIAAHIRRLLEILSNRAVLLGIMKDELTEVREQFHTPRRTQITDAEGEVDMESLIKPEEMVVTLSSGGYVKRQALQDYRSQRRGGKGKAVTAVKEDEEIETLFIANTHDPLLFFTNKGQVHRLKVYALPLASPGSRGKAFVNLLKLEKDEIVNRVLPVPRDKEKWEGLVALFATNRGLIRKTPLVAFNNVHSSGIRGMALEEGDSLIDVAITGENDGDVLLTTRNGQAVRFEVSSLRTIASRTAYGVKGITLRDGDEVASMVILGKDDHFVLTVTENGYGKRTDVNEYPAKSRGTIGVIDIKTSERNGGVIKALPVAEDDQVMIVTHDAQVIRTRVSEISVIGRNTQGVRLFKVDGSRVVGAYRIPAALAGNELDDETPEGTPVPEGEEASTATAES